MIDVLLAPLLARLLACPSTRSAALGLRAIARYLPLLGAACCADLQQIWPQRRSMVLVLGRSSPRMSFRSLFARLLRCSVRAGTSQPIPVGQVHSTKPAWRSSFGSAISPLCSSYSAPPTCLRPLGSAHSAQPTRLSHHDQVFWCCAVSCARPPCPTLDRSAPRSARVPDQGQFGTWSCWSSARATWCSAISPLGRSSIRSFRSGPAIIGRFDPQWLRSSTVRFLGCFAPSVVHSDVHAVVHATVHVVDTCSIGTA